MAESFPLGRTEVIAGIDEIVIHIIQDIENRQNHKGKLNVACERLALDGDSLRVAQAPRDASQVRRCCEVVDDVGYHLFKDGPVAYFVAQADVLVDNLADNFLSDRLHETRISDTRTNR